MSVLRLFAFAAVATVFLSSTSLAQGTPRTSGAPVASQMAVGVHRVVDAPLPLPKPAPFRGDTHQNRAMMIVGGAALLTGAIIGGDAGVMISVGGAVVGLWGLYQFLQ